MGRKGSQKVRDEGRKEELGTQGVRVGGRQVLVVLEPPLFWIFFRGGLPFTHKNKGPLQATNQWGLSSLWVGVTTPSACEPMFGFSKTR